MCVCVCVRVCGNVCKDTMNKGTHLGELVGEPRPWQQAGSAAANPTQRSFLFPTSTTSRGLLVRHIGVRLLTRVSIAASSVPTRSMRMPAVLIARPVHHLYLYLIMRYDSF